MQALRNLAFAIAFYGLSVPIVLGAPLAAAVGHRPLVHWVRFWALVHRWCARWLMGVRIRVEGAPLAEPGLYPAKHQAMFETIELVLLLGDPVVVIKRELTRIPVWGWAIRRYGAIPVDRDASAAALRAMVRGAEAAKAAGRPVLIFPEGTRVMPGEQPPLRPGFAGLYRALKLPTVPVALDTGAVWPRRGARRPGTVTFRFGEPIGPGLPRAEIEARVHAAINALDT